MQKNKSRLIVDTNLWVSFLISKSHRELLKLIEEDRMVLLFSRELLEEVIEVAERTKMRKYFPLSDVHNLLYFFELYGEIVTVKSKVNLSRDIKDNFLLDLAIDGKADYLITGDKDLLSLNHVQNTRIITYSNFKKAIFEL